MRRLFHLLVAILLVGCSRSVPAPVIEPSAITPQASGLSLRPRITDAVPGGELWLDTSAVPPGALHTWTVGLTDGAGKEHRLGWLTEAANYRVPRDAAPGAAEVWISTGETAQSPGTIRAEVKLLVAHETYTSKALGLSFDVPAGWRLYEQADSIRLERTAEQATTPVESIVITPCPSSGCQGPSITLLAESERWVVNRWIPFRHLRRTTRDGTASWEEMHLIFPRADLMLAYRPDLASDMEELFARLAESLRFVDEPAPEEPPTLCEALLAEVHLAIGPDWTETQRFECSRSWFQPETGASVSLKRKPLHMPGVLETRLVTLQGKAVAYPATLGQMIPQQMGWKRTPMPNSWVVLVAGARGEVMLTCSVFLAEAGSDVAAMQAQVDERCLPLLQATKIENLGKPMAPPQG